MAKTYPAIGPFNPGDILTAATMTDIDTNLENQRVPPMAAAYRNAALSHTSSGAYQVYTCDTELFDTDGMWTSGANASRITLNTAGVYQVTFIVSIGSTTSTIAGAIYKDGVAYNYGFVDAGQSTSNYKNMTTVVVSTGSTYVEPYVYQASGGNLAYGVGTTQSLFAAVWLGQTS